MEDKLLIGIIGPSGSGKTPLADLLCESILDSTKYSFATMLRTMLKSVDLFDNPWRKNEKSTYNSKVDITHALIKLGESLREVYGEDILVQWMDSHIRTNSSKIIVIDDVRMPNELDWLLKNKAIIIVLTKPFSSKQTVIPKTEVLAWKCISNRFDFEYSKFIFCDSSENFAKLRDLIIKLVGGDNA